MQAADELPYGVNSGGCVTGTTLLTAGNWVLGTGNWQLVYSTSRKRAALPRSARR